MANQRDSTLPANQICKNCTNTNSFVTITMAFLVTDTGDPGLATQVSSGGNTAWYSEIDLGGGIGWYDLSYVFIPDVSTYFTDLVFSWAGGGLYPTTSMTFTATTAGYEQDGIIVEVFSSAITTEYQTSGAVVCS